jgi:nucleotide-binding universal stress UspA family protein
MSPITSILAATDLSAPARHAAERAARLAREHRARLALVHVLAAGPLQDLRAWLGADSPAAQRLEAEAGERLAAVADELARSQHLAVDTVCRPGPVLEEIAREGAGRNADLLVLGARGQGFLRRLVLGTTSERLLRRTDRPVLVVREVPRGRYRRVLIAADFSPWSADAVRLAVRLAPRARLMLLHAWEVPFEGKLTYAGVDASTIQYYRQQALHEASERLQALADEAGLAPGSWEPVVVEGDPSLRLAEQEQERDADLVVLGKHGRSVTEDLLLGSVTRHVLAEGTADVLVSTRRQA